MPRSLQPFSSSYGTSNNPTQSLGLNPLNLLTDFPDIEQDFLSGLQFIAELPFDVLETLINTGLGWVDQVTGLDLESWATDLESLLGSSSNILGDFTSLFSGFAGGASLLEQLIGAAGGSGSALSDFGSLFDAIGLDITTVANDLIGLFTGTTGGLTGTAGLGSIFTDIEGLLGNPTSLGSGSPVLAAVSDIPILGGLFSGAVFDLSLIPDLPITAITDLSTFIGSLSSSSSLLSQLPSLLTLPISQITNLSTLVGGFTTSSSILNQLIGLFSGTTGGLSGTTGLGAIFADIESILGSPTSLGSGSPSLPGVSSIPLLGGLFSGAAFLTTLIPNLAASKITSGTFATGLIPNITKAMSTDLQSVITNIFGGSSIGTVLTSGAIPNVTAAMSTDIQSLVDQAFQASQGGTSTGNAVSTFFASLTAVPFTNVLGTLGPDNIGSSVETMVDSLWQGFTGGSTTGNSLATLSNAANMTSTTASSAATLSEQNSSTLANQAVTQPSWQSIDPTANGVFPLTNLTGTTPSTVGVTQMVSVIGMVGTPNGGTLESIVFLGQTTTNISSMILNVYSVNTSTGVLTLLFSSSNIIGSVSNSLTWNYYAIPSIDYIAAAQGDWYAVEMQVLGTGTYALAGIPNHWLPANPNSFPKQLGATRGPAAPVFDAVGAGSGGSSSSSPLTVTVTVPTANPSTNCIVVYGLISATGSLSVSTKIGSTTIPAVPGTAAVDYFSSGGTNVEIWAFALMNPPTGTQTVTTTFGFSTRFNLYTNAVVYENVGSIGSGVVTSASSGTAMSHTVTTVANQLVSQIFATDASGAVTAYNQTQRFSTTAFTNVIGDGVASGTSTVFSATQPTSVAWGSIAVTLNGFVPSAPSSISSPVYSSNVPWFGLAGSATAALLIPQTKEFSPAGSYTYTIPTQFQTAGTLFDIIVLGAGGGGCGASFTAAGLGGSAGSFNAVTLTSGTDFSTSVTTFSVTIGAGGAGSAPNLGAGSAGSSSTVTITGYGTITGSGGAGGPGTTFSNITGAGAGTETFNSIPYYGGLPDNNPMVANGPVLYGNAPGGGGAGGTEAYSSIISSGSTGADGAVWIRVYQP